MHFKILGSLLIHVVDIKALKISQYYKAMLYITHVICIAS